MIFQTINQCNVILYLSYKIFKAILYHNHGEGPYFSWLKAPTSAFTFKTLLRPGIRRDGHLLFEVEMYLQNTPCWK